MTVRPGIASPVSGAELRRVIEAALDAAGAPATARIGIILSDDAELAALNAAHLGKAGPTDVLSFPLLPPAAFAAHAGQSLAMRSGANGSAFALPPRQRIHLGEIVVSVERATEQARAGRGGHTGDVRWSAADEVRLLVAHGTLHLCGWDHAEAAEEAAMRTLEGQLLSAGLPERVRPGRSSAGGR